jgi:hypothetical protein
MIAVPSLLGTSCISMMMVWTLGSTLCSEVSAFSATLEEQGAVDIIDSHLGRKSLDSGMMLGFDTVGLGQQDHAPNKQRRRQPDTHSHGQHRIEAHPESEADDQNGALRH